MVGRIIFKSLIWNLNCIPSLQNNAIYGGYPQKSIVFWIPFSSCLHRKLTLFLYWFSLVYNQPLPLNLALSISIYVNIKIKQTSPHTSYPSILAVLFSLTSQWNFQKSVYSLSLYFLTSHSFLNIVQSRLQSPHVISCCGHSDPPIPLSRVNISYLRFDLPRVYMCIWAFPPWLESHSFIKFLKESITRPLPTKD